MFSWILILAGCSVGPSYRAPSPQLPDRWHQEATEGLADGKADIQQWWQVFQDAELSSLIQRAAGDNLDVRLAVLRIREARALRGVAAGELLPTLGGSTNYLRSKGSENGPSAFPQAPGRAETFGNTVARGVAGRAIGTGLAAAAPNAPGLTNSVANGLVGLIPTPSKLPETDEMNLLATGFDASWEIDVFGGIRRNVQAADATLQASVENYRDMLVSLLAEVASTYVEVRTLQNQIRCTRQNIAIQQEAVKLARVRLTYELATKLDVELAETNLSTTESQLPQLESGLAISIYRLSVLLGRQPADLSEELSGTQSIPKAPPQVLAGVPTDILRQRPDIRSAERQLAAQTAQIGVATAALYPQLTLSGTFGFESTDFNHLLDDRSISYGFGPAVRWNIFDGLRNLNRIAAQQTVAHQAYVMYQRTLLMSLQEVENSLVAYNREQVREKTLLQAVKSARSSVELAENLYRNGLTDFQNVLEAERSLATLENTLAQSQGQIAINLVSLYKALGGGWSPEIIPQQEYLEDKADALHHPFEYFFSGGKSLPPWPTTEDSADRP